MGKVSLKRQTRILQFEVGKTDTELSGGNGTQLKKYVKNEAYQRKILRTL